MGIYLATSHLSWHYQDGCRGRWTSINGTNHRWLMLPQAVGQICATASMSHNLAQCQMLVLKAVAAGAKVF
jgi:hypothetical protein